MPRLLQTPTFPCSLFAGNGKHLSAHAVKVRLRKNAMTAITAGRSALTAVLTAGKNSNGLIKKKRRKLCSTHLHFGSLSKTDSSEGKHTYKVKWCPGITTIRHHTLTGLPPIEELIIPETVTEIESSAFSDLEVSRISFPIGLKSIPSFACSSCYELKQVEIPDSVEKIEYGAFLYCHNLSEIRIPESVMTIEENAFKGCDALPEDVKEQIRFLGGPEALEEPKLTDVHKGGPEEHVHCVVNTETLKEGETENKDDCNE